MEEADQAEQQELIAELGGALGNSPENSQIIGGEISLANEDRADAAVRTGAIQTLEMLELHRDPQTKPSN